MKGTPRPGPVPPASVFLDPTGRRKRWSRLLFRLTMAGFAAYVGLLAASLIGNPRLDRVVPRSSAGIGRRFVYRPPTGPAGVAGPDDRSTSPAVAVPDYAAALEGIAVPSAALSRPTPVSPATSKPGAVDDAPAGAVRPETVMVTTMLRSSDWPLAAPSPGERPAPTAPTTSPTTAPRPSTGPTATTPATDAPGGSPPPTTTTTTAPAPAPTTGDGRGPAGQGPPGLLRKTASQPTG